MTKLAKNFKVWGLDKSLFCGTILYASVKTGFLFSPGIYAGVKNWRRYLRKRKEGEGGLIKLPEGWITTKEAAELTGYTTAYIRMLCIGGKLRAQKWGRDWAIERASLLAYKARMDALGPQKHNPWREEEPEEPEPPKRPIPPRPDLRR